MQKGKLWRGARESAAEIGHIVMQIDGPLCGCGNRGCLEALASRSAIERDLRAGDRRRPRERPDRPVANGDLSVIRSGALRQALEADDPLVIEVMRRAAEILGYACLTVRHLIDPEVIVLGGGVVEACSEFIVPIVENIVGSDRLPGARDGGRVLLSALGDDAVVLGAVALARKLVGRSPFKKRFAVTPEVSAARQASTSARSPSAEKTYDRDIYIRVNGKVKKRDKTLAQELYGASHIVGPKRARKVCRGGPEVLFVGVRPLGQGRTDRRRRASSASGRSDRNPAHAPGRRGLQQVEAAQGGVDACDLLSHICHTHSRPGQRRPFRPFAFSTFRCEMSKSRKRELLSAAKHRWLPT